MICIALIFKHFLHAAEVLLSASSWEKGGRGCLAMEFPDVDPTGMVLWARVGKLSSTEFFFSEPGTMIQFNSPSAKWETSLYTLILGVGRKG